MKFLHRILSIPVVLGMLTLAGCSKESSEGGTPEDRYYSEGKAYLDELFGTYYYWNDEAPTSVTWNMDFYDYFDDHLVSRDRWSWMETGDEWRDSESGTVSGSFGVSYVQPIKGYGDYSVYVRYVLLNSPMYDAGVRRGWRLDGIGGYPVSRLIKTEEGIDTLYREMAKTSNEYIFTSGGTVSHTVNVSSASFSTPAYLDRRIFTSADYTGLTGPVGYFNYRTFVSSGIGDLVDVFAGFKSAGVEDLILDLRYNGGGSTEVLDTLVSLIVPESLDGKVFSVRTHNALLSDFDDEDCYAVSGETLSLKRLFVITGTGTASASEVLINGLSDGLGEKNLITVGDTTYGKPNGMYVFAYPEGTDEDYYSSADYVFLPICFYNCNRAGRQIPDSGFPPLRYEADDVYHDWGADERLIANCLHYIATGSFDDTKSPARSLKAALRTEGYRISTEEDAPGYGRLTAEPGAVR